MDFRDCIDFANENPVCYVATIDGDQPRVRAFGLWKADEGGLLFSTSTSKDVYRQLQKNPRVEICFYAPEPLPGIGKMMRVAGEVEFLDDLELKRQLLEDRPFLREMGITPEDPLLVILRVRTGEFYFWTMEDNLRESEIERVRF